MTFIQSVILAIIEGLTEYLPVSSTGHIIIGSYLMGIHNEAFTKSYTVMVQFGAILAVLVLYYRRFLVGLDFYKKLLVGFLPAAVIGFLAGKHIDRLLGSIQVVGIMLILGGVVLLFVDKWVKPQVSESADTSYRQSLGVGLFQCLAFLPGTSRSAATIVGGLVLGLDRARAAEFSFFLAVPTLSAATLYKSIKILKLISPDQIQMLVVGNLVAFVVAMLAIRGFIGIVMKYGFRFFGIYRIIIGIVILALAAISGESFHLD